MRCAVSWSSWENPAASVFGSISTGDEATSILGISGLLKDCKNSKEETEPRFPAEHGRLHKGAVTPPICSTPSCGAPSAREHFPHMLAATLTRGKTARLRCRTARTDLC